MPELAALLQCSHELLSTGQRLRLRVARRFDRSASCRVPKPHEGGAGGCFEARLKQVRTFALRFVAALPGRSGRRAQARFGAVRGRRARRRCRRQQSVSCGTSCALVRKNTSLPLSLASRKADSRSDSPEEISATQPRGFARSSHALGLVLVDVLLAVVVARNERIVAVEEQAPAVGEIARLVEGFVRESVQPGMLPASQWSTPPSFSVGQVSGRSTSSPMPSPASATSWTPDGGSPSGLHEAHNSCRLLPRRSCRGTPPRRRRRCCIDVVVSREAPIGHEREVFAVGRDP